MGRIAMVEKCNSPLSFMGASFFLVHLGNVHSVRLFSFPQGWSGLFAGWVFFFGGMGGIPYVYFSSGGVL